ncbi:MAG: hypothetical protein EP311_00750 [Cytophagales bacterium]|nr:MAG: hypothetical protein EP311_00750 [Cytophagales bacterium]
MYFNDLLDHIKSNKKIIFSIISAFVLFGLFLVLVTPKTYRAQSILLPESTGSSVSNMGSLGQLASSIPGLGSLALPGTGSEAFRPEFYPAIIQSTPFLVSFRDYQFYHSGFQQEVSIQSYLEDFAPFNFFGFLKKYTIGLPGIILSSIRGDNTALGESNSLERDSYVDSVGFFKPTVGEYKFLMDIKDLISVGVDKKNGSITIAVETTNAEVSAHLAQFAKEYLMKFIKTYRIEKQNQIVSFLSQMNIELKQKFLDDQSKLASFKEKNLDIRSPYLQNQLENLSARYELSKSLYFSVNSQLEQAKIKLNEETPIFAEIEPVSIPAIKSKPQTMLILFLMGTLGILSASLFVLIKIPKKE